MLGKHSILKITHLKSLFKFFTLTVVYQQVSQYVLTWGLSVSTWQKRFWRNKVASPRTNSEALRMAGGKSMLDEPCHVLWPRTRVLKAGKDGWVTALKGINEHQRNGIVVQLRTWWTVVLHPETNKWNKNSKAVIEAKVCLHEPCVGRTQPGWKQR